VADKESTAGPDGGRVLRSVRHGVRRRVPGGAPSRRGEGPDVAAGVATVVATATAHAKEAPALCCAPLVGASISTQDAEATAALFKALADPTRVRIVNLLANSRSPVCVCDMNDEFELSQPTMSHHLKKLVSAGLLDREQRGTWAYYSLNRAALRQLASVVQIKGAKR
jgi:ArsR family transcriptional regulator